MTFAFVIIAAIYLVIASFAALNSVLEAERPVLAFSDLAVIVLVSAAWPFVGCALLSAQAYRQFFQRRASAFPPHASLH